MLAIVGNFDPDELNNPCEAALKRQPNRHFNFGCGVHLCLGQRLAKREMRVGIAGFFRRILPFKVKPDADLTVYPRQIAARHVPIAWDKDAIAK